MPNKYYFLTDFIDRDSFLKLRDDFERFREAQGKHSTSWGPGELEKYAFEKGLINSDQYRRITDSTLM